MFANFFLFTAVIQLFSCEHIHFDAMNIILVFMMGVLF